MRNYPATNETKPISERFEEITRRKQEILKQLKSKVEQESQAYFHPQIDPQSKIIAQIKNNPEEPVEQRLMQEDLYIKNKKKQLIQQQNYIEQLECTFQPNTEMTQGINNALLKYLPPYAEGLEIQERHKIFDEFKQQKMERAKQETYKDCSFRPNIDVVSQYLIETQENRAQDFDQRLYTEDFAKRQAKKQLLEEEYNSQYTYQPRINQKSKSIYDFKSNSLDDLAYDQEGKSRWESK